jgi:hypothetical protein
VPEVIVRPAAFAAWLLTTVFAGSLGPPVRRPAGAPTTAPATRPAADASTPKGALRALLAAASDGDAKAVAAAVHVERPINRPIADAAAESLCAYVRCMDATAARFAPKGPARPEGIVPGLVAELDAAPVRLDGPDNAVVGERKWSIVKMRRRDGVWKIAFEDTAGGFSPDQQADAARETFKLQVLARFLNRLAGEVRKGMHPTPEAVQQEVDRLRKQADETARHMATQPSARGGAEPRTLSLREVS